MHWAPISVAEFDLPPPTGHDLADGTVFRLLSRAPRRGFWLSAIGSIGLLVIGLLIIGLGGVFIVAGVSFLVLCLLIGTGHYLMRHKLNVALWITREPSAVYWAEPKEWAKPWNRTRRTEYLLTLHTPAPVRLEVLLAHEELIAFLHWLRRRNPDVLIGRFSPNDSNGKLSGDDPWSPQATHDACGDPIDAP